jgi:TolB-like protein/tRNA A-37 threonylcarbamoyl transferase component Bud32/tetratricopeptide (TPR) repeat protein
LTDTLQDQLARALGDAYRLERELGGGGMSRVFLATEIALDRRVVVKVLHPELAAELTAERFAREIQLIARLQQANIVPLLTTGRTRELPYYTMPFVDGLSLRQRIAEHGALPIAEAISVLRDVARALAYAHDAGIAHRDIKPENVLLSGGAAVVTDFGIAKAVNAARNEAGASATLTKAGVGIGTPAYMSPEQATGDPRTDHRADIYAFGCLAYELLTGHPPFRREATHELITAHMVETPASVLTLRADTPAPLARLVERCLEKSPDRRPQSARELLDALDAAVTPSSASDAVFGARPRRTVVAGVIVGLVIIASALVFSRRPAGAPSPAVEPALAVIPFVNVGGDSTQDYLADGVSDELATEVGRVPHVHLAARSASYRFRGRRDVDVRELGKALQVQYVVQGTVRRIGDQLRISAQLSDAQTGRELWAQSFDRTTQDVFRTQDDIARAVTSALVSRLAGAAPAAPRPAVRGTSDAEAYDLYLRGEFFLRGRQVLVAADMFRKAIARDANFARAYAGLSQTLALMPYYAAAPTDSIAPELFRAANAALARDSTLAEAHMAIAMAQMHAAHWAESKVAFDRAVAADPNDVQTHFQYGRYFFYLGEDAKALAEWNRVKEIDPFSALASAWSASTLAEEGHITEAIAEIQRAWDFDSSSSVVMHSAVLTYIVAKDAPKMLAYANRLPMFPPWIGTRAYVLGITGNRAAVIKIIHGLETQQPRQWMADCSLALAYLAIGDTAQSLTALERSIDRHEICLNWVRASNPIYDPLRKSPRWAAVLRRVGLADVPGAIR